MSLSLIGPAPLCCFLQRRLREENRQRSLEALNQVCRAWGCRELAQFVAVAAHGLHCRCCLSCRRKRAARQLLP